METNHYKYDAFISYRHGDLDQFTAEKLHRLMETFRMPKIASENVRRGKKTRINRVFRDRDELPIASNLSENILSALKQSEFLIVICSPRTSESIWVKKEIETFISLHGRDHVLAVLVKGEPADSFPEVLRYEEKQIQLADGEIQTVRIEVEPLAADVRGENERQILKKLKQELLRLAAAILGCDYDDLRQRHRERIIKRRMMAAVLAAGVFLIFGSISTALALRIQRQSMLIKDQSDKIEEQYREVMDRQLKSLADTSLRLLDQGDRLSGILVAKEALETGKASGRLYSEQAQYALAQALHVYENGRMVMPSHLLKLDTDAAFFKLSPSGERILAVDISGKLTVWEALSGELLCTLETEGNMGIPEEGQYCFLDDSRIFLPKDNALTLYDLEAGQEVYCREEITGYSLWLHNQASLLSVDTSDKIVVLEAESGKTIYEYPLDSIAAIVEAGAFNQEGSLFGFARETEKDKLDIVVIDLKKKKAIYEIPEMEGRASALLFTGESRLAAAVNGSIVLFDLKSGKKIWSCQQDGGWIKELKLAQERTELLYRASSAIGSLKLTDGKKNGSYEFDSEVAGFYPAGDENYVGMLRDGSAFSVLGATWDVYLSNTFLTNSNNISDYQIGSGFNATLPYGSNAITIYESAISPGAAGNTEFENSIQGVEFRKDGKECLFMFYCIEDTKPVILFDLEKNETIKTLNIDGSLLNAFFIGEKEDTIAVITTESVQLYDTAGNFIKKVDFTERISEVFGLDKRNGIAAVNSSNGVTCLRLDSLEQTAKFPFKEFGVFFATGGKLKSCALVSQKEKTLSTYDLPSGRKLSNIPIRASFVSELFMDEEETLLFVTYRDNTVEVYDRESLELLHIYTDLTAQMKACKVLKDNGCYLLSGDESGYLCRKDSFEAIAFIRGFEGVLPGHDRLAVSRDKRFLTIPVYDVPELLEEADKQLNGLELTEEQKKLYHIE